MRVYDVAIIGGGMSGVTAALTFAQLGLNIALIEAVEPSLDTSPSFDQRAIALSASSVKIYQTLGLWSVLQSIACPITDIHVSDKGHYGFTRLTAKDYQLDALGQVVALEQAGPLLWQQLDAVNNIEAFCPAKVAKLTQRENCAELHLIDNGRELQLAAKLVIAADGTFSKIVTQAGIEVNRRGYQQAAIIANITTEQPHLNRAFERFTATGPLALLPLTQNRLSLVWCHKPDAIESVMSLDEQTFMHELQAAFGFRLGKINRVGKRVHYPLSLHLANHQYKGRLLLLGNSAHTLHPIAGQGFNLGLRDIAALADLLQQAIVQQQDIGSESLLAQYVSLREPDWQQTIQATDALARLFSQELLAMKLLRNKAMNWVNLLPFAKNKLAQTAMGYSGQSSRLARGIPLKSGESKSGITNG